MTQSRYNRIVCHPHQRPSSCRPFFGIHSLVSTPYAFLILFTLIVRWLPEWIMILIYLPLLTKSVSLSRIITVFMPHLSTYSHTTFVPLYTFITFFFIRPSSLNHESHIIVSDFLPTYVTGKFQLFYTAFHLLPEDHPFPTPIQLPLHPNFILLGPSTFIHLTRCLACRLSYSHDCLTCVFGGYANPSA